VGRLSDHGWGGRLRGLLAEGAPDQPAPPALLDAVVEVLKAWARGEDPWRERPSAVVSIGSRHRPELVRSVAAHVARVGRLPLLGTVPVGAGGGSRANSAQRVRALYGSITVPAEVSAALAGPVLLVDDYVDSGWTMALAARELRLAGATAVLPLALALSG
jgi:ATP-dependent DNA helicase RecQ